MTDSSQTIIDCLVGAAEAAGVELQANRGVASVARTGEGLFALTLQTGKSGPAIGLILATGGCRTEGAGALAVSLGHTLQSPVPSLFTFEIPQPWLRSMPGSPWTKSSSRCRAQACGSVAHS